MKDNKYLSIKEEVFKCSKCGLCHSVCPVYLCEKNETHSPRGRYLILNNMFNNSKPLSKKFIKDLDICLNCNLCKNFCPSNIDSAKIFTELKNEYYHPLIPFSLKYSLMLRINSFIRQISGDRIFKRKVKSKKSKTVDSKGPVLFFEGCYNKYINDSDKNAVTNIIEETGYSVKSVISKCCGYPYLCEGNLNKFHSQIKKIENIISTVPGDIICSCDCCLNTLKNSLNGEFASRLISFDEFLLKNNYVLPGGKNSAYFKPITRTNPTYIPVNSQIIEKKGLCSTGENFLYKKHKSTAKKSAQITLNTLEEYKDKEIYTSCMITRLGLSSVKKDLKIYSLAEYISLKNNKS